MIEKFEDIGLVSGAGTEAWEKQLEEKFGLKIIDLQAPIGEWIAKNAEGLAAEFPFIVPDGDYGKLIDDEEKKSQFLKEEATKLEHWKLTAATEKSNMIQFQFDCPIVENLKGFTFLSKSGKIKHAFAQNDD